MHGYKRVFKPRTVSTKYCGKKCQPSFRRGRKKYRALTKKKYNHPISKHYSDEIYEIYNKRPDGHHVDHIIPLNHKLVCGLHVPWNLQYLPAEENMKKSNKIEGLDE